MKNRKLKVQRSRTRKFQRLRKDIRVRTVRKVLGLRKEAIRNPDGSVARGNKKLESLRKDYLKFQNE